MMSFDHGRENGREEKEEQQSAKLSVQTEEESHQLLVEWNQTTVKYPRDNCIHELFEEQVEKTPDAIAVEYEQQHWTYQELNDRANRIARYLRKLGVQSNTFVGLFVKPSLEMVAGILGILKAGGAYVPLDPSYPSERINFILEDTQAPVVLTQSLFADQLMLGTAEIVQLDGNWAKIAQEEGGNLDPLSTSDNLAYVIYTSGTTGKPKGVLIPQYAVVRLVRNTNYISIQPHDRIAQISNISFDAATFEIWGALLNGARLVGTDKETLLSPLNFRAWLQEKRISTLFCTTAVFHKFSDVCPDLFSSVKQVFFGGESSDPEKVLKIVQASKGTRVVHVYGPTESTTFATWYDVLPSGDKMDVLPIGRPLSNTKLYVLDAKRNPVPIGDAGELYIAGDGLAKGYLNQPELTAERFVSNPFDKTGSMYKTGDLVCYLPDGNIKFIGRVDNQVKIRGFRIELDEITSVLRQCNGVQEAVVDVKIDAEENKTLVAYVVGDKSQADVQRLRQELMGKLPEFMIPSFYVWIDDMPLTPNGKVDKKALPMPTFSADSMQRELYENQTEELVYKIWAEILRDGAIRPEDDFFMIGGHSLSAMQVIARMEEAFGVQVDIGVFFKNPTIRGLAETVTSLQVPAGDPLHNRSIQNLGTRTVLPMSPMQQRQWFLYQMNPESPMYNEPIFMELKGHFVVEAMERSLNEVARRHEALRTVFRRVDGEDAQVVLDHTWTPLAVDDWSAQDQHKREEAIEKFAWEEARLPFNLSQSPIRWRMVKLESDRQVLFVTMHHIIMDGWSIGVFIEELSALYNAFCKGEPSPLPELPIQYGDFTVWQKSLYANGYPESQMEYWLKKLSGALPILQLPTDYERPSVHRYAGGQLTHRIEKQLLEDLHKLSRRQGVSLYMTLLAAFNVLLYRYTGQEDLLIGTPVANRNHKELEALIGNFVNTVIMRSDVSGNPSFAEFLGRVRETALEAYNRQDVPFEKLVEELQPERSLGQHSPLFQVLFVLQNTPKETWLFDELEMRSRPVDLGVAKFDLKLQAEEDSDGLYLSMDYNADLFEKETIQRMIGHFEVLLRSFAEKDEQNVGQIQMLTPFELQQLLVEWNDASTHPLEAPAGLQPTKVYVLDARLNPVPIGVVGELYLAGVGWSESIPGLVQNPFASQAGWMYKTGDFVCYQPDGSLKFIDRVERQVDEEKKAEQLADKPAVRKYKITDLSKDKLEYEMLSMWKEIIGKEDIDMDSDFFEVGGYSLLGLLLVARIEQKFKVDIPIPLLITAGTPRRLCNAIRTQVEVDSSRIVKLQDGNDQTQIFMIHPAGGGVFCYMDLARQIDMDATIYGIQAIGIDTDDEPLWDVSDFANLYLQEISKVNHGEPMYFVGWSSGGTLAYEIIRRLEEKGCSIGGLTLIDTLSVYPDLLEPEYAGDTRNSKWSKRLQIWKAFCESKGVSIPGIENMTEEEIITYMNTNAYKVGILHPDVSREMARRELRVSVATVSAVRSYKPTGAIRAAIDWIVGSEHTDEFKAIQKNEWMKRTSGQFTAWESPGNHNNIILRPNVEFLAKTVNQILGAKQLQR